MNYSDINESYKIKEALVDSKSPTANKINSFVNSLTGQWTNKSCYDERGNLNIVATANFVLNYGKNFSNPNIKPLKDVISNYINNKELATLYYGNTGSQRLERIYKIVFEGILGVGNQLATDILAGKSYEELDNDIQHYGSNIIDYYLSDISDWSDLDIAVKDCVNNVNKGISKGTNPKLTYPPVIVKPNISHNTKVPEEGANNILIHAEL